MMPQGFRLFKLGEGGDMLMVKYDLAGLLNLNINTEYNIDEVPRQRFIFSLPRAAQEDTRHTLHSILASTTFF